MLPATKYRNSFAAVIIDSDRQLCEWRSSVLYYISYIFILWCTLYIIICTRYRINEHDTPTGTMSPAPAACSVANVSNRFLLDAGITRDISGQQYIWRHCWDNCAPGTWQRQRQHDRKRETLQEPNYQRDVQEPNKHDSCLDIYRVVNGP